MKVGIVNGRFCRNYIEYRFMPARKLVGFLIAIIHEYEC
jgi:hypothetical protein